MIDQLRGSLIYINERLIINRRGFNFDKNNFEIFEFFEIYHSMEREGEHLPLVSIWRARRPRCCSVDAFAVYIGTPARLKQMDTV